MRVIIFCILSCMAISAHAQSIQPKLSFEIEMWHQSQYSYEHRMTFNTQVRGIWNQFFAGARLQIERWSASKVKNGGSFLNAEGTRVWARRQSFVLGRYLNKNIAIGVQYDRRSVHHVWWMQNEENRHDYFPGNWKIGRRGENGKVVEAWGEVIKPSLGYWEGLRPYFGFQNAGFEIKVRGLIWTWKTLTLPRPDWNIDAKYNFGSWDFEFWMQFGRQREQSYSIEVKRNVFDHLYIQAGYTNPAFPEWQDRTGHIGTLSIGLEL